MYIYFLKLCIFFFFVLWNYLSFKDQTHLKSFIQCWDCKYGFVGDTVRLRLVNIVPFRLKWEDFSHTHHIFLISLSQLSHALLPFFSICECMNSDIYTQDRFLLLQEWREAMCTLRLLISTKSANFSGGGGAFCTPMKNGFIAFTTPEYAISNHQLVCFVDIILYLFEWSIFLFENMMKFLAN